MRSIQPYPGTSATCTIVPAVVAALALLGPVTAIGKAAPDQPPDIIIFLADDLGYADIGVNGCRDIPTPHIDALARDGVRFTNGYANHPVCAPTRAALLSGRYQHRFGFEHNPGPERAAADNFGLPQGVPTLAERLRAAGYATGMVGKWHVGFAEGLRPWERGFDFFFGFLSGARTYLPGRREVDPVLRNGVEVAEKEYLTDAFAREAVAFLERSAAPPAAGDAPRPPFFLYVAFNAVHAPLEAKVADEARFATITDPKRKTYAGMLAAMDDAVGRVMAKVRELGQEENTLVFFFGDNGGPTAQTTSRNDPLRGYKGQVLEGGIRVPFLAQWKGTLPADTVYAPMVAGFDVHATALAAAGAAPAPGDQLDGVDLLPFLTGAAEGDPHDHLAWRTGPQHALRAGDWKLVQLRGEPPALYHLTSDIGETTDLSAREPERLRTLQETYTTWAAQMQPAGWQRQDGRTQRAAEDGATPTRPTLAERFRRLDRNGDGRLTPDELPRTDLFERMDANQDGVVTADEVRANPARRGGQPAGRARGTP